MATVFDRFVWLRDKFRPEASLTAFAEESGVSHATLSQLHQRWRKKPKAAAPGRPETWETIAATWKVRSAWLMTGDGQPTEGVIVDPKDIDGLGREFERKAAGSGSYPAPGTAAELPPQPTFGRFSIPDQVRADAATFLLARRRPDDPKRYFSREEVWAGFRNVELSSAADASKPTTVAAAVKATILGEDEAPLRPPARSTRAGHREP